MTRYIGAVYLGHDSTFTVYDKVKDKFKIIELDKLLQTKHFRPGNNYKDASYNYEKYFNKHYEQNSFETILLKHNYNLNEQLYEHFNWLNNYTQKFYLRDSRILREYKHHVLHAWSSYIQSPFDKAFTITWDGTGDWASNSYMMFDKQKEVMYEENSKFYGYIYEYVSRMFSSLIDTGNSLDYAGKTMGLSAYGRPTEFTKKFQNLLDHILETHDKITDRGIVFEKIFSFFDNSILNKNLNMSDHRVLFNTIRVHKALNAIKDTKYIKYKRHFLYGSEEMDVAWAVQNWIENKLIQLIEEKKTLIKECNNNLILSGGVALNVLANQKAREKFKDINFYVSPNPSDCGLSLGMLAKYLSDKIDFNNHTSMLYSGMELKGNTDVFKKTITLTELIELIKEEKIIGLLHGDSEIGPRALGHRSIICLPKFGMKKKINEKVKFREWFRPFAPVCTPEMAQKYFVSNSFDNMESMSYAIKINEKYKNELDAITHVDNTARLQIVKKEDNEFLYSLINTLGTPLLNTSFNVQGKPILNSMNEALRVLKYTNLDHIVYYNGQEIKII